jgi:hypothetical protein
MAAAVLLVTGLAITAAVFLVALIGLVLKLIFRLIFFPLFLLKWIVTGLVMLVVAPVIAIVGIVLSFVFALLVSIPLLPVLFVGALLWMLLVKANRRPAAG